MQEDKSIMRYESVLPTDFDGTFRFSNPSKEDFIGVWGGKQYLFPAETMTPMIMLDHSPLEIQHIRKKFAKDFAEREWYKSKAYKVMQGQEGKPGNRTMNSIHQAAAYTISDLEVYIQQCLKPLPLSKLTVRPVEKVPLEDKLSRNENGDLNSDVVAGGQNWNKSQASLKQKALNS